MSANNTPSHDPTPSAWDTLGRILPTIPWDWPGWLPRGFLTILAGQSGAGKSLIALRIAASYLDRRPWPDGTRPPAVAALPDPATPPDSPGSPCRSPCRILWCEGEDGHALNIERARRLGLNLDQILAPLPNPLHSFKLDDPAHAHALRHLSLRPDIRLVILDSLRGIQARPDRPNSALTAVVQLAEIAHTAGKPFLLTHHLRRRPTLDHTGRPTLDSLHGSPLIAQAARVIWAIDTPDFTRPNHRRLSVIKNNLTPLPPPVGFTIVDRGPRGLGIHFGPPPIAPANLSELDRAIICLRDYLAPGPKAFWEARSHYLDHGISDRTARRAKALLGVTSIRPPGQDEWYWSLPNPAPT
jgi:hypothetical protein